jgi:hypothetical protein
LTNADLHAEFCSRINRGMSAGFQYGSVQKHVPGPVGELDKAEPLIRIEPFDGGVDGRSAWRRIFPGRPAERLLWTRIAPIRRRILVVIKSAPSLAPVSSSSHFLRSSFL